MPVEVEVHTVPHFEAPVNAKVELWGLECGGTFIIQTSLLKIGCSVHKLGFVGTEVVGTVDQFLRSNINISSIKMIFAFLINI